MLTTEKILLQIFFKQHWLNTKMQTPCIQRTNWGCVNKLKKKALAFPKQEHGIYRETSKWFVTYE